MKERTKKFIALVIAFLLLFGNFQTALAEIPETDINDGGVSTESQLTDTAWENTDTENTSPQALAVEAASATPEISKNEPLFSMFAAPTAADDLITTLTKAGLIAFDEGGGNISVYERVENATATLSLTIDPDVTVNWYAEYTGTPNPLIDLKGGGTFVVRGGEITNLSGNSYTALRANGLVDVIVENGTISSGLGSAFEGTEMSSITVKGGHVFNAATHNLRPVINMTNEGYYGVNVTISGGEVSANADGETAYGYTIQTYGDVYIDGGKVFTGGGYGRGINLTGRNSNATIAGGEIFATGSKGVAVSTATTAGVDVTDTKIYVTGGLVYATTGMAIRTTGKSSTVTVSGGLVIAYGTNVTGNNNVIYTQNNAAGFSASSVYGGMVIAWNEGAGRTNYDGGLSTDIIKFPNNATATWAENPYGGGGGADGIIYANGFLPQFISFRDRLGFTPVNVFQHIYALEIDPTAYEFPYGISVVVAGVEKPYVAPTKVFTIRNVGTDTLNGLTVELTGIGASDFEIVEPMYISSLAPGATATVEVRPVSGLAEGDYSAELEISVDEPAPTETINLSFKVYNGFEVAFQAMGGYVYPEGANMTDYEYGLPHYIRVRPGESVTLLVSAMPVATHSLSGVWLRKSDTEQGGNTGTPLGLTGVYPITNIDTNYFLFAEFSGNRASRYNIIAYAAESANGKFAEPRSNFVQALDNKTFTLTADPGYFISEVRLNGTVLSLHEGSTAFGVVPVSVIEDKFGNILSAVFTFNSVHQDHVISAAFDEVIELHDFSIEILPADVDGASVVLRNANLKNGDTVQVRHGDDVTFEVTIAEGYEVLVVEVDDRIVPKGNLPFLTFPFVTTDHKIKITVQAVKGSEDNPPQPTQPPTPPPVPSPTPPPTNPPSPTPTPSKPEPSPEPKPSEPPPSPGPEPTEPTPTPPSPSPNPSEPTPTPPTPTPNPPEPTPTPTPTPTPSNPTPTPSNPTEPEPITPTPTPNPSPTPAPSPTPNPIITPTPLPYPIPHEPNDDIITPTFDDEPERDDVLREDYIINVKTAPKPVHDAHKDTHNESAPPDLSKIFDTEKHTAYVQGVGDNLFQPDRPITRAEAVQVFYNLLHDKSPTSQKTFPDAPSDEWYFEAINALTAMGIIDGYPDGNFYPQTYITRAEFVAMAVRFTDQPRCAHNARFADVSNSHWAYECINTAICYGWINGHDGIFFTPDLNLSRAEALTIVNRMLHRHPDTDFIDSHKHLNPFTDVTPTHWAYYNIMEAAITHDILLHSDDDDSDEDWLDDDEPDTIDGAVVD